MFYKKQQTASHTYRFHRFEMQTTVLVDLRLFSDVRTCDMFPERIAAATSIVRQNLRLRYDYNTTLVNSHPVSLQRFVESQADLRHNHSLSP